MGFNSGFKGLIRHKLPTVICRHRTITICSHNLHSVHTEHIVCCVWNRYDCDNY